MLKRVHIICHKKAGQGKGGRTLREVQKILDHYQVHTTVYDTTGINQAGLTAKRIVTQSHVPFNDEIMVIGGDGTLHDVVQSLHQIGKAYPISYIPAGTGNDFGRAWLKGKTIQDIVNDLLFDHQVTYIPVIQYHNHLYQQSGLILNSMGFGIDALANRNTQEITAKLSPSINKFLQRTRLAYPLGLFASLSHIPHFEINFTMDGQNHIFKDTTIAIIVNNPFLGGGIKIDNISSPSLNKIALMIYHDVTRSAAFDLIHRVLIKKNQDKSPNVLRIEGDKLMIKINEPVQGQVDGEAFKIPVSEFSFTMASYPFIGVHPTF